VELQGRLERDLKTALLAGDKKRAETIRGLKNSIQYAAVELKIQKSELKDDQVMALFAKEAKKRQEAIDLYQKVGETGRAASELAEKQIIEDYLPAKLSDDEVQKVVMEELGRIENPTSADMGRIIGQVRGRLGARADGAVIARLVKQALESQ
jgi:uncharacterized protein